MLEVVGFPTIDALVDAAVPPQIRLTKPLALPAATVRLPPASTVSLETLPPTTVAAPEITSLLADPEETVSTPPEAINDP